MITARRLAWPVIVLSLTVVGVFQLAVADESAIGPWGLITAYSWLSLICLSGLVMAFVITINFGHHRIAAAISLVGVLLLLHGAPAIVEPFPRFQVAWLHAAFVDHLATDGVLATNFDARFAWPGFFAAAAALLKTTGADSAIVFLQWAPTILVGATAVLVAGTTKAIGGSERTVWMSALVFLLVDWVGQDYFAPQPVAYLVAAGVLTLTLAAFRHRDPGMLAKRITNRTANPPKWWTLVDPRADGPDVPLRLPVRLAVLFILAAGILAVSASHQLTPIVLTSALALLAIAGRLRPWPVAMFALVSFIAWLSYVGEPYWTGHLSDLFNELGKPGQVLESGVEQRVGGSPQHVIVLRVRMLLSLLVGLMAIAGLVARWRRTGRVNVPAILLAAAPLVVVAGGSYGGEGFLRIFYFSLLGLVPLIAFLVFPDAHQAGWGRLGLTVVMALLALPLFLIARFGNESFERVSSAEVQLAEGVRASVPPGSVLIGLGDMGSMQYQGLFTWDVLPGVADLPDPAAVTATDIDEITAETAGTVFVVATPSQIAAGEQNYDYPKDWAQQVRRRLVATGDFRVVLQVDDGFVLERI